MNRGRRPASGRQERYARPSETRRDRFNRQDGQNRPYRKEDGQNRPYRGRDERPERGVKHDVPQQTERPVPENLVYGRNPVREALRGERSVEKVLVQRGDGGGPLGELIARAKEAGVPVQSVERQRLDELCGSGLHQGVAAFVAAQAYAGVEDILKRAAERGEDPFILILDGVEDPHNLGSILRTAECAGVHGVIIPKRRAVGLTPVVAKASSGAIEFIPVARVTNIARTVDELKQKNIWVACGVTDGEPYTSADLKGPLALVIGGEGEGVSHLVEQKCDFKLSVPMRGRISSLNASVAAAVLVYEAVRQRQTP
ncbi:MAG: 23S rRNA (guanosine(2251)-2'-O)-methyltransferase RlmB [Christensenellales bacterium]|jgi:23S rRNA (guanosine2251-2'-O)-methyltransferase